MSVVAGLLPGAAALGGSLEGILVPDAVVGFDGGPIGSELRLPDLEVDAFRPYRGEGGSVLRYGAMSACFKWYLISDSCRKPLGQLAQDDAKDV